MFIGHFAVAFAAKKATPKISLGTLFLATLLLDLFCLAFLILGIEHVEYQPGNTAVTPIAFVHYPFSHSLLAAIIWATLFSLIYKKWQQGSAECVWLWLVVMSHWILDVISHGPDLALFPGGPIRLGLGLWNSLFATMAVEILSFFLAVGLYLKMTRATTAKKMGTYGLWAMVVVLFVMYIAILFALPPPNTLLLFIAWIGQIVLVLWTFKIDRSRQLIQG